MNTDYLGRKNRNKKSTAMKIISIVLALCLCFTFSSCSLFDYVEESLVSNIENDKEKNQADSYVEIDKPNYKTSEYYTPCRSAYSYDMLKNEGEKKLYEKMLECSLFIYPQKDEEGYKMKQIVLEDYLLSEAEVRTVITAFINDRPEYFWISTGFGYYEYENLNYTAVQNYSYLSPMEVKDYQNSLIEITNSFFDTIDDGLTEYEREKYVHDYLSDICVYDDKEAESQSTTNLAPYNIYGVLVNNLAVCEGYSRAFEFLLTNLGVDCVCIIGEGESELHMWNSVKLGGDWYYVDLTWDDSEVEYKSHFFFNITEEQLLLDHTLSKTFDEMTDEEICGEEGNYGNNMNIFLPSCDSIAYNYYVRECPHFVSVDSNFDEITDSLYESTIEQSDYFIIYIDKEKVDFDQAIDSLFVSYPQEFFDYVESVNSYLDDYSIDNQNVSYVKEKSRSIAIIELNYL